MECIIFSKYSFYSEKQSNFAAVSINKLIIKY